MSQYFTKSIVARYLPQLGCDALDGDVLYVRPLAVVPVAECVPHRFVSCAQRNIRSSLGWIVDGVPFTIDEFVARYLATEDISEFHRLHLARMFERAAQLDDGTAVRPAYFRRGVQAQWMVFDLDPVHSAAAWRQYDSDGADADIVDSSGPVQLGPLTRAVFGVR